MSITEISSSKFLSDAIIFLRDKILENVNDPLQLKRGNEKFVLTEYPQRQVIYPVITITDAGSIQEGRLGMSSQGTIIRLTIEIRVWARNVIERDSLFNKIHEYLRTNQIYDDDISGANLHDFSLGNVVNVSEENVKSKIMEVNFLFLCI